MQFYGWIGKNNSKKIGKRDNGTDTASYIKYFANQIGASAANITEINSKNLLEKNGRYYYILSISNGKSSWAPYPFIDKLAKKESYMLLTIDGVNKGEGTIFKLELSDEKLEELGLSLVKRDDAGDYYYLPLSKVNEIKSEEKEYQMMNDGATNYIKEVLKKLMQ